MLHWNLENPDFIDELKTDALLFNFIYYDHLGYRRYEYDCH